MPQDLSSPVNSPLNSPFNSPIWPACERLLADQISALIQKKAALLRAEERARERIKSLSFIDTSPALTRSEAFAEDLLELPEASSDGQAPMRGLAGVALGGRLA